MRKLRPYMMTGIALSGLLVIGSVMEHRGSVANGAYASPVQVMNTPATSVPASMAMPANPVLVEVSNSGPGSQTQAFGPGQGNSYAITSLTLSNFEAVSETIRIFQPILTGGVANNCNTASITGGGQSVRVSVPAGQSLHLTFPSPIVINTNSGTQMNCAAVAFPDNSGSLYMTANGFWQ
jgi:hypothetical protein